jgi:hypothetical protein
LARWDLNLSGSHPLGHSSEFQELSPIPSLRALLGASMPWFGLCLSSLQLLLKEHHLKRFLVTTSDITIAMTEIELLSSLLYH